MSTFWTSDIGALLGPLQVKVFKDYNFCIESLNDAFFNAFGNLSILPKRKYINPTILMTELCSALIRLVLSMLTLLRLLS
jgi:hypothetical protein